jgi:YidC/Oxa1 family membrane protein insertase
MQNMSGDDQKSFLDSRTILAVLLMIGVWIGWQTYLSKKYPQPVKTSAQTTPAQPNVSSKPIDQETSPAAKPTQQNSPAQNVAGSTAPAAQTSETVLPFVSPEFSFKVSSNGMGLKDILLNSYVDRKEQTVTVGSNNIILPFQTSLKGQTEPLRFQIEKLGENEFKGTASVSGATIVKTLKVEPKTYTITASVEVNGNVPGITTYVSEESLPQDVAGKNLQDKPGEWLRFLVATENSEERKYPTAADSFTEEHPNVSVAALGSHYFSMAVADTSSVIPTAKLVSDPASNLTYYSLDYPLIGGTSMLKTDSKFFVGPMRLDLLRSVDPRLQKVLDFGMFSWIAYPILDLLRWFYKVLHNYGLAIIALTLLVRLLVLPFNVFSYKSMKAMQAIQPEINRLKERHKDDRDALNREMMILMRDNKVNPLGGCLPMLLQLPVFIALYKVLNETVDLYRAPFGLWIHDLSLKDPFYVLPVLMGITMFIQQKITPTTMDPAQAKVMLFMPVMFTFLMISLPSGLTLYIFVSTLFGIIQQLVFMRDRKSAAMMPSLG